MRPDRWWTLNIVKPLQETGLLRPRPGIPILMYHSISDDPEPGVRPYYRLTTPPSLFREQMRWLVGNGYRAIGQEELLRKLGEPTTGEKLVVLTFDDGFRDFRTTAWPVLEKLGLTATVFVPTGLVGKSFLGRELLNWDEIRELRAAGIGFGSHTVRHPELVKLSRREVEAELRDSRKELEDRLGEPVLDFCHPYAYPEGDRLFCRRLSEALLELGYRSGLTTRLGRTAGKEDPFSLPRLPVNAADDLPLFAAKLEGAYDWLGSVQRLWKGRKSAERAQFLGSVAAEREAGAEPFGVRRQSGKLR